MLKKTIKKSGSAVKETASHVASTVASKTKSKATESLKSTGKSVKEKAKSGLDSLKTVSKNTSSKVSEKIKSVGNKVKETAKNPIKAGTIAGAVAGGVTGGMVGFGVGNMVKDVSDGVKQVKSKLLENLNWEEREKLLEQERKEFKLFIKKYGLQTIFKDSNYWSKRGGYVGQKTINNTISKLITKGWKTVDLKTLYKGGGENVLNKIVYLSPEKNYYIETSAYYGNVASDNMFNMNIINMKDKLFENLMLQSQQEFTDLFESKKDKFSLAFDKMDKWMPDDSDIQNDFYEAIENKNKKKGILEIEDILIYADEDILSERYNISPNEYSKFAKYLYEVNQ